MAILLTKYLYNFFKTNTGFKLNDLNKHNTSFPMFIYTTTSTKAALWWLTAKKNKNGDQNNYVDQEW
jgi:hypothetical protein